LVERCMIYRSDIERQYSALEYQTPVKYLH